mmetsp:Transcript_48167/g.114535  ORF Transcript_48167/g.114535 Transcript_48167/m.114535 type:complete len:95 (+) Transcript_48167:3196-3480(+)
MQRPAKPQLLPLLRPQLLRLCPAAHLLLSSRLVPAGKLPLPRAPQQSIRRQAAEGIDVLKPPLVQGSQNPFLNAFLNVQEQRGHLPPYRFQQAG